MAVCLSKTSGGQPAPARRPLLPFTFPISTPQVLKRSVFATLLGAVAWPAAILQVRTTRQTHFLPCTTPPAQSHFFLPSA